MGDRFLLEQFGVAEACLSMVTLVDTAVEISVESALTPPYSFMTDLTSVGIG